MTATVVTLTRKNIFLAGTVCALVFVGGCEEDSVGPTPEAQKFTFSQATLLLAEGSGAALVAVKRAAGAESTSVLVRTLDGTATADADYEPIETVLIFADSDSTQVFSIQLKNDLATEEDEQFSVTLQPGSGLGAFADPSVLTVTVIDNDPAGPPRPVHWPLVPGSQWSYEVHGSSAWDGGGSSEWSTHRIDGVTAPVRFKGLDYQVLEWGERPAETVLLRQEGSLIFYAFARDTLDDAPGSLRNLRRSSLPWRLVDFLEPPGDWQTHFSYDTTAGWDYWYMEQSRSRYVGRSAVVGPTGIYRDVAVVALDRSLHQFPRNPTDLGQSRTLYFADSIGVVRETGYRSEWFAVVPGWSRMSWSAELLPAARGQRR